MSVFVRKLHIISKVITVFIVAIIILMTVSGCGSANTVDQKLLTEKNAAVNAVSVVYENNIPYVEIAAIFVKNDVPESIRQKMQGVTIGENSRVGFENLSYLTVTHMGYDGVPHIGNIIVDKELADEVLLIFRELYEKEFPIERMELPCNYDGIDELSMQANNTSSFNDRPVTGGTGLSYHQLGRAIDINPLVNPYVKTSTNTILPQTAGKYTDRTLDEKGMIKKDSECVKIFKKYGWSWGGDWKSLKDYQHFEKR